MPTDVVVAPDGRVFVADGVNRRVVVFAADGAFSAAMSSAGDTALKNPIGIDVHPDGRLLIADAGLRQVLVRDAAGALVQSLAPPSLEGGAAPDPTDVAVEPAGKAAWVVDNENHRLLRFDLASGAAVIMGSLGESVGKLHHPFMLALTPGGDILTSDVINGRISVFSRRGGPLTPIGAYGVDIGQLYRPKGVACDAAGRVWVSDSLLGRVQVFSADGAPLDVLRDAAGKPFAFEAPMGLAFDGAGRLYVVEQTADRVVCLNITQGATPMPRVSTAARVVGQRARRCTVCHIEWIVPFARGRGTELVDLPPTSPDEPFVSRSEMCLSCHDASIADSRSRVWLSHGHRTGIEPPADMAVPDVLPLAEGKIACRTCHAAHTGGSFTANFRTAVFLRVANPASELCISCHPQKTRGPEFGTHPVGGMPWAIPQPLVEAGAKVGPNPRELTCQVCHTPHGSKEHHLLVMGTSSNQLCLTCHDQMRPGMFRDGSHAEHPLSPEVNAEQASAVRQMGTQLGPNQELICLSCHQLHHGKGGRFMLADELTDGKFCLSCHSGKSSVLATSHDLRTNCPDETNRLGMTAQFGGPCSACHMFHRYARRPVVSEIDPGGGKCVTCHQRGECAESKTLGPINHPEAKCVGCHDPHDTTHTPYLRAPGAEMCASCHASQAQLVGGPHDCLKSESQWPEIARATQDRCLACHRPHGDEEHDLYRIAPAETAAAADGACIACHPSTRWDGSDPGAAQHPRRAPADGAHGDLPLVRAKDSDASIVGCRTCHDPHAPPGSAAHMLRVGAGESSTQLCVQCHSDAQKIMLTSHGAERMAQAGLSAEACMPCHQVHGAHGSMAEHLFWPRDLASPPPEAAPDHVADAYCTACHREDGSAPLPATADHPDLPLFNMVPPNMPGFLPLYNKQGAIDPRGRITCRTCHAPHGRDIEASVTAGDSPTARKAMRLLLRPFVPPNVCTNCHGVDGLRRFLYFHDPERRGEALADFFEATPWRARQGQAQ